MLDDVLSVDKKDWINALQRWEVVQSKQCVQCSQNKRTSIGTVCTIHCWPMQSLRISVQIAEYNGLLKRGITNVISWDLKE